MTENTRETLGVVLFVLGLIVGGIEIAYMNARGQRGKGDNVTSVTMTLVGLLLLTAGFDLSIKMFLP